jgi:asparagine synthase (glutamine-hydrolysing)
MSDFLLDLRDAAARTNGAARAASLFKFCDDTRVQILERKPFSLVLARVDDSLLWGPFECSSGDGNLLVALAGRIALDEPQWEAARRIPGDGGLACKAICEMYVNGGIEALANLNGNFVALIYDETKSAFHIVTDRCGMQLVYASTSKEPLVFASHPDVLASVLGESHDLDKVSLAEFLMTSRFSFPFNYYRNIQALDTGSIYSLNVANGHPGYSSKKQYFRFDFKTDSRATQDDLAGELALAFKKSVQRRTLPLFGRTGVGLSGGLDSRAILSSVRPDAELRAFSLFDKENLEFRTARAIANACNVELIPIKRDFDYYGNSAELGVKVSGGSGCVSCNHFSGVRNHLNEFGLTNLLTGCYCDYLLKGLPLNRIGKFSGREDLALFQFEFYDSYHWLSTPYRDQVVARLSAQFPESSKKELTDQDWLEIERKRIFPLAYEQDLAQRTIPQRLMPWYVPIVDNDVINVYLKIPARAKLNASLFKRMVSSLCPRNVRDIPDSNTGAAIDSSTFGYALHHCLSAARNRFNEAFRRSIATSGSWPNWRHYVGHSKVIASLWERPNKIARELFQEILGEDPWRKSLVEHADSDVALFQRLLTQKLWLDQRLS